MGDIVSIIMELKRGVRRCVGDFKKLTEVAGGWMKFREEPVCKIVQLFSLIHNNSFFFISNAEK